MVGNQIEATPKDSQKFLEERTSCLDPDAIHLQHVRNNAIFSGYFSKISSMSLGHGQRSGTQHRVEW